MGSEQQGNGAALECVGLTKAYNGRLVVDHLSLHIPRGSLFGVVGPNGAGKTTTLSMATGLLRPDAGTARILEVDVWADPPRAKQLMGVSPDGLRLFEQLSGRELLHYVGALRRMPLDVVRARSAELLRVLGLAGDADVLVSDYSAGMTKKIALACALIHAPKVLVLDEPFEAVDPVSAETIRSILRAHVARGGTVVMSSHVMELVQELCDHVAIVDHGRILDSGPTAQVRAGQSLHQRFLSLVGGATDDVDLSWLGG